MLPILWLTSLIAFGLFWKIAKYEPACKRLADCRHSYFILKMKIRRAKSAKDINECEDFVHDFFRDYLGKVPNQILKDMCGELHATLNNQLFNSQQAVFSV